jgi:hypothetical protein
MKNIILVLALILLISCNKEAYKPEGLHLITQDEMIEMMRDQRFPIGDNTVIKNERGELIPRDSIMKIPNLSEDWTLDMYINDDFELVEMVLRPATREDNEFKERLQEEARNPQPHDH